MLNGRAATNNTKSTTTGNGIVSSSTTIKYSADGKFPIKTTNGFGIQTTLNYKPLTDSSVYTKDTNGSYPNINIQNARQVISTVTHKAPNTPNITRTSSFTYNNKGLLSSETITPQTQ